MEHPIAKPEHTPFFQSTTVKLLMVGILALFLLIPLELVKGLIAERAERQKEVISEITEKWGDSVTVYGPVLKVPYNVLAQEKRVDAKTKQEFLVESKIRKYAYFLPDRLDNASNVKTDVRSRGNYDSTVFTADMNFTGFFVKPSVTDPALAGSIFEWDKATLLLRSSNLKGIRNELKIRFGNRSFGLAPVYDDSGKTIDALETSYLGTDFLSSVKTDFSFGISYNGSSAIRFVPVGKVTSVKMNSNWQTPSFQGNFIPAEHTKADASGFAADWKILPVSRPFSQQYFGQLPYLDSYAFGVDFVVPVDEYLQNERASKYGFLVIGLTFVVFFLIQTVNRINIHIFQYGMIGVALVMFYTLLISITEHSSFDFAYVIASIAVILLISLYSLSVLKDKRLPVFIGASLTTVYTFIFVIIQLEDYALLVGSIGLFAILAAVMYFSRKIDWKN